MSTAAQMRTWRGPALFTYGFRPFFLGAALWAGAAMVLWIAMLSGAEIPTHLDPVSWHAHAFLFGYLGAVIAGFLLTAVPNWTGRLPITGWPLAMIFALWIIGRGAMLASAYLPPALAVLLDLAYLLILAGALTREIFAGRNWRNLMVVGMLGIFILGNGLFHLEAAQGDSPAYGYGLRIGLGAALMMIALIGGRIIPSFTRNWLVKQGKMLLPTPPMQALDKGALLVLALALSVWIAAPETPVCRALLAVAGLGQAIRLLRWQGQQTGAEPLVWILHLGFAFLPLGAFVLAIGHAPGAAQHLWMAGAIGLMTLAVMTRASLGHTGQTLAAGSGTCALYLLLLGAVIGRWLVGYGAPLLWASGLAWITAFWGFALIYGPLLLSARKH